MYAIGPVAQVLFAPVLVMAEAKMVERVDCLRDAALFNHWLFEHADLPIEKKREIASAWLERWGSSVEAAALSVADAAKERLAPVVAQLNEDYGLRLQVLAYAEGSHLADGR